MKFNNGHIILLVFSIILGFTITVMMFNSQSNVAESSSVEKIHNLMEKESELEKSKESYLSKSNELEKKINDYQKTESKSSEFSKQVLADLDNAKMYAGLTDVEGPGVEVILNDRKKDTIPNLQNPVDLKNYLVHDIDIIRVLNELDAAGAEAISINDTRIVSNTRISCGGPIINIKNQSLAPPYVIHAIGDPDAIANYITNPPGNESVYKELTELYGIQFTIKKLSKIKVPKSIGANSYIYAKPIQ